VMSTFYCAAVSLVSKNVHVISKSIYKLLILPVMKHQVLCCKPNEIISSLVCCGTVPSVVDDGHRVGERLFQQKVQKLKITWSKCTGWRTENGGHHLIANILKFHDRIAWKLVNFRNIIC